MHNLACLYRSAHVQEQCLAVAHMTHMRPSNSKLYESCDMPVVNSQHADIRMYTLTRAEDDHKQQQAQVRRCYKFLAYR